MGALLSFIVIVKIECTLEKQDEKVIKRKNDHFMGRFECFDRKNRKMSRLRFDTILFTVTDSFLGFPLKSERIIEKWASKKMAKLNPEVNTKE